MNSYKVIKNVSGGTVIIHKIAKDEDGIGSLSLALVNGEEIDLSTKYAQDETAGCEGLEQQVAEGNIQVISSYAVESLESLASTVSSLVLSTATSVEELNLGKAVLKPVITTADIPEPSAGYVKSEIQAMATLINELKAKVNSMNTIV